MYLEPIPEDPIDRSLKSNWGPEPPVEPSGNLLFTFENGLPSGVEPIPYHTTAEPEGVIRIEDGPMKGQIFRFKKDTVIAVGRDPSLCNLVLEGYPGVSRVHCRIVFHGERARFVDMHSTNGTYWYGMTQQPGCPVAAPCPFFLNLGRTGCILQLWTA